MCFILLYWPTAGCGLFPQNAMCETTLILVKTLQELPTLGCQLGSILNSGIVKWSNVT